MTIRDKQIELMCEDFNNLLEEISLMDYDKKRLKSYYHKKIKAFFYNKDNEIGELKERLSLFQNTSVFLKMKLENLLSGDKDRLTPSTQ